MPKREGIGLGVRCYGLGAWVLKFRVKDVPVLFSGAGGGECW